MAKRSNPLDLQVGNVVRVKLGRLRSRKLAVVVGRQVAPGHVLWTVVVRTASGRLVETADAVFVYPTPHGLVFPPQNVRLENKVRTPRRRLLTV